MQTFRKRALYRVNRRVPILLKTKKDYTTYLKDKFYYTPATMCNHNEGGMYFESDYALQPGMGVSIALVDPQTGRARTRPIHRGKVRWCREIDGEDGPFYGVGVEIVDNAPSGSPDRVV
jgi:hypothetical protein